MQDFQPLAILYAARFLKILVIYARIIRDLGKKIITHDER